VPFNGTKFISHFGNNSPGSKAENRVGWDGGKHIFTVWQSHKPTYCLLTLPLMDELDSTILLTFILPGQGGMWGGKGVSILFAHDL